MDNTVIRILLNCVHMKFFWQTPDKRTLKRKLTGESTSSESTDLDSSSPSLTVDDLDIEDSGDTEAVEESDESEEGMHNYIM